MFYASYSSSTTRRILSYRRVILKVWTPPLSLIRSSSLVSLHRTASSSWKPPIGHPIMQLSFSRPRISPAPAVSAHDVRSWSKLAVQDLFWFVATPLTTVTTVVATKSTSSNGAGSASKMAHSLCLCLAPPVAYSLLGTWTRIERGADDDSADWGRANKTEKSEVNKNKAVLDFTRPMFYIGRPILRACIEISEGALESLARGFRSHTCFGAGEVLGLRNHISLLHLFWR